MWPCLRLLLAMVLAAPALWAQQPQAGDQNGAIRTYREYLDAHPDSVEARSNLGAALARAGRYDEAIAEYDRALAKSPANPALLLNLGLAYYKTGRPAEAAARFEQAASRAPQFKDQVTLLLASCYNSLGKYKQAIALLAPLEQEKAADQAFDYLYGTALVGDGQDASGAAAIDRILSRGDSAEARLLRATIKLRANDHEGALAEVEKAIALNSRLPGAHARMGEILFGVGDIDRARTAFEQELAFDPDDFVSNLDLGVMAKQDQEYAGAHRYFERALKARPNDAGVRYQIANLDLATGNADEARKTLEALTSESPDFAEAHATLATVYYRLNRSADGEREHAVAKKLIDQRDAAQTGAKPR
ncbi:MAG: tetratricopeptide repeat protein [Bryobacteraceae bacterium]|jgi:tetratricopeptide (TPR) repeat protein